MKPTINTTQSLSPLARLFAFAGVAAPKQPKLRQRLLADWTQAPWSSLRTVIVAMGIALMASAFTTNAAPTSIDLSTYVRVGRYDLPEPTRTTRPPGTPTNNLLAQEASGVTYNWDTDTLFVEGDGGTSITQVTKTGVLVDTMTLATGSSPQGTEFYDPEGITYIGGGKFVMVEERDRQVVQFTYIPNTTLTRAATQTVDLGTFVDNIGIEGLSYDPQTGGFICVKEINPQGIFQTGVNFTAGTATNGSASTVNSTDLFNPALLNLLDFADVFALSNLPSITTQAGNILVLSQESGKIVNTDRTGNVSSSLTIHSDPGNPLNVPSQQHEGLTMDRNGNLYVVSENGGGDIDHPQLWVYAPSLVPNAAPTAVALSNTITSILENTSTIAPIRVADILVTDDGLGNNTLTLTGADASFFEITGESLYIKAGTVLDFETKTSYSLNVNVDDTTLGSTPDATVAFTLSVTDVVNEVPVLPSVFISEVHSTGSSSTAYGADWFEITNNSAAAATITGWKMDDNSNSLASAVALRGLTTIPAGKSAVFIEGAADGSTDATILANFCTAWFGQPTPPAGVLIGFYGGSGVGLSSGGDAVNVFDAAGSRIAGVAFGAATSGVSFDNHAGLSSTVLPLPTISTLSVVGVNSAFLSTATVPETGSPGTTGKLIISEVAPWSSGNSPVAADWFEVTNLGATPVDLTGWKMDDNSESFAAAVPLSGISSIAPGETVIFIETANLTATKATFLTNWFGANPPASLKVGSYSGSGVGLGTGGDAVNLFDSAGVRVSNVAFGVSPGAAPFTTFDNKAGLNVATITTFSAVGVNGAFAAVNSPNEVGSPGALSAPLSLPGFSFASATTSVVESAGSVTLTINRTGDLSAASINVSTANGTGIAGTDYTTVTNQAVSFAANATTATVSVPVINRPGIRSSRTFTVSLSNGLTTTPATATVTITEADTYASMTGPSSSKTPYIQSLVSNWQVTSLLSVGDQVTPTANPGSSPLVSGKYEMAGIPDGVGAFDNGNGTFTMLVHHELNNTQGVARAHGSIGAFISEWIIDKATLQVISGSDLIRQVYGWDSVNQVSNASPGTVVFNRFCSADLPAPTALYNAATGLGTQERVFLGGDESGGNGYSVASVATGPNKGKSYILGKFNLTTNGSGLTGVGGWENLLANPFPQDKTIVIGNNDGGTGIMSNSVAIYQGTKTNTGSEADKAGLTNGTLKFINVTGNAVEITNTTTRATGITTGTRFTLSATTSTTFSRPEDGAWDPSNPRRFYFATTDRLDQVSDGIGAQIGRTRLWRLTFDDITNPDAGGTIDLLIDGGGTLPVANDANMFDNLTVTNDGKVVLCEDVGGAPHNGKVWFYDPATTSLTKVIKHDISRFGDVVAGVVTNPVSPFTNDEETSGVIDVTHVFGGNSATGERTYLIVDQAHYTTGITPAQVEGGQLLLLKQAATFLGIASGDVDTTSATLWAAYNKTTASTPINVQVATDSGFTSPVTTASSVPSAANGWITKVNVTGLTPGTTYFYRFVETTTGEISATGKFKTAPAATTATGLRFAFSGDNDGIMRPYPLASTVPALGLDFFVNLGDTIYENASASLGNNGAPWLNSPSVTLSGTIPGPTSTGATQAQLAADYAKKYKENFLPVNVGGQHSLKDFYAAQGNYTQFDNHELGNRQYINGGAPRGGPVGDMATGAGVDARVSTNDVNTSTTGDYMNKAPGFQTLIQTYVNWMPVKEDRAGGSGFITAAGDSRTDGTRQFFFNQQWGKHAIYLNVDDRSYRDIRLKTPANADDTTAPRANNPSRTMLGSTQFTWLKSALLAAQTAGVPWKFVAVSDPIDQLGPIGGALTGSITAVNADGGKSWIGGYRAERNALLKYIADNRITNVVFLATDDHQNRINELTYSPTDTESQATYVKVPFCFSIVCGPLGATGPETITNHAFSNIKTIADDLASRQSTAGIEPLGLIGYPGLKNLTREGDPTAGTSPQAVDFYSPDTFNYTVLDVSADGKTLTVTSKGINAFAQNAALEYNSSTNPVRDVFSFQIDAASSNTNLASLSLGGPTIAPAFDPAVINGYTATVPNATTSVVVTPVGADSNATITVNGSPLVAGSSTVSLNVGSNTITVLVTAQDGNTKTYTITITRLVSSFSFASSTSSVNESAGKVTLTINRTGDMGTASVNVSTANGTATSGTDYTALSNVPVAFAANDTSKTVDVNVTFRPGIQGPRTFTATLSGGVTASPSTATVTINEADTFAASTGPSSTSTPYVLPLSGNWQTKSILTVGDGPGGYQMAGIPDGLGAYDNGNGTITLLMNHELGKTVGTTRAHGAIGSFVSEWVINKSTLAVVSGSDLMRQVYQWNTTTQASDVTTSTIAFSRFCSADLPAVSAFYNAASGKGTQERIFMNGEESTGGGSNGLGYALGHVATGPNKGKSYILGKFNSQTNGNTNGVTGWGAWENVVASPYPQDKTVVMGPSDGGTSGTPHANSVAVYVGTKTNTGTEVDKAGLTNGLLYFINVMGNPAEIVSGSTRATNITSGTAFTLSATSATTFSRPEDGSWDPTNPNRFYFATTDQRDDVNDTLGAQVGRTRLWRLNFTSITNPEAGGTIDLVLTGGIGGNDANMWDNMTVTDDGKILLQEDVGGAAHNGKVWFYDPTTGSLTKVLKHDAARFGDRAGGVTTPATAPYNNDEETSGIIDVSAFFGGNPATGDRTYLLVDQAHYTTGISSANVEGGQLLLVKQISSVTGPSTTTTPYVLPMTPDYQVNSILTVGDSVGGYEMVGIPDGLGAFDNGDGTFTLLMNHELGKDKGVARAHGAIGAFVSQWVINKSTLAVVSGGDLMQQVYQWDVANQRPFTAPVTTPIAFSRFCSADLPAVSAFYNAASGKGTQERIFMNGEESTGGGATNGLGYALGHVATGPNKGKSYILGKFNSQTNGNTSGVTGWGAWENVVASPYPQDKTIVMGPSDGGTSGTPHANSVAVYIGTKTNTGTEVEKAGLTNGLLYFINVTGNPAEIVNTTTRATNITSGSAFTLSATAATTFSRPEDGSWDPTNPNRFYFATTDQLDRVADGLGPQVGRTRLWRLNFTNIATPEAGGTIDLVLTGGVGNDANMWDNMTVTDDGKIMLQEDVGGAPHNGKVWFYDPTTTSLTKALMHDPARFGDVTTAATLPFTNDEETSGIIDVSSIFGSTAQRTFLLVDQAHYTTGITTAQVEGGQLLLVRQTAPTSFSLAVFNGASTSPVNERADYVGVQSFGNAGVATTNVAQTFTIQNNGTATLTGLAASSTNAAEFIPGTLGATILAPGATTTFTVTFSPSTLGARSGLISIASNIVGPKNPFEIQVAGTGVCPTVMVVNPSLNTGVTGNLFSQTFSQSGGVGTITYTTSSTLPTGISLSSSGLLFGTTSQTGTFPIIVTATDINNCVGTGTAYNLVISAPNFTTIISQTANVPPGVTDGARFSAFYDVSINNANRVIYSASLAGGTGGVAQDQGTWTQGSTGTVDLVLRSGTDIDGVQSVGRNLLFPRFGDNGVAVLQTDTAGAGPIIYAQWVDDGIANVSLFAKRTTVFAATPENSAFRGFTYTTQNQATGEAFFASSLVNGGAGASQVTTANDSGVWKVISDGTVTAAAREGDALPATIGVGLTQAEIQRVAKGPGATGIYRGLLSGTGVTGNSSVVALRKDFTALGDPVQVIRTDAQAAGCPAGCKYYDLLGETINTSGKSLVWAHLTGAGVNGLNNRALFSDRNGAMQLVIRYGQDLSAAFGGEVQLSAISTYWLLDDNSVVVQGLLAGSGVTGSNDGFLALVSTTGTITKLIREGEVAPAIGNSVIDILLRVDVSTGGRVAVLASTLNGTGDSAGNLNNQGLLIGNVINPGAYTLALRKGSVAPGGSVPIWSIALSQQTVQGSSGSTAGMSRSINNNGKVAVMLVLYNNDQGIFVGP